MNWMNWKSLGKSLKIGEKNKRKNWKSLDWNSRVWNNGKRIELIQICPLTEHSTEEKK